MATTTLSGPRLRSALSQLRGTPVAGPSRVRLTTLRPVQTRLASTRPGPPTTPRNSPSQRTPPTTSGNRPPSHTSPMSPNAGRSKWPWRPIPSNPGVIEEERVIFSRPYEGPLGPRVKMLWFIVPIWGFAVGVWATMPKLPDPPKEEGEEGTVTVPLTRETPLSVMLRYTAAFGMFSACLIAGAVLLSPSRIITRLSQVRVRPASGSSVLDTLGKGVGERSFVRMQHGGHLMSLGNAPKWREIPVEEIRVRMLRNERSPYLDLKVLTPHKTRFNFDAFPYRLDFRDTPAVKKAEDDVVLSIDRLETVFGKIV